MRGIGAYDAKQGFQAAVVLDKVGRQKHKFASGSHVVAGEGGR